MPKYKNRWRRHILLEPKQEDRLDKWLDSLRPVSLEELEETCDMSGRQYNFHMYDTGLGPVIWATTHVDGKERKCNLTLDDDGELCDE